MNEYIQVALVYKATEAHWGYQSNWLNRLPLVTLKIFFCINPGDLDSDTALNTWTMDSTHQWN